MGTHVFVQVAGFGIFVCYLRLKAPHSAVRITQQKQKEDEDNKIIPFPVRMVADIIQCICGFVQSHALI